MIKPREAWATGLPITLFATILLAPAQEPQNTFTLGRAIPDDVFLYVAQRHNPERAYLDQYWGEVCQAFVASGVAEDFFNLITGAAGPDGAARVQQLRERGTALITAIDWGQLGSREVAFAERFSPQPTMRGEGPPTLTPSVVVLLRETPETAPKNHAALVALLEALVEEINKTIGAEGMHVQKSTQHGAQVASVNMLEMAPGAPPMPVSIALRDDLVILAFREDLLAETLALLDGKGEKQSIAKSPRVAAAFRQLPPAEDSMTYFDTPALLKPIGSFVEAVMELAETAGDVTRNTGMNKQADEHHGKAMAAYRRGDIEQALAETRAAHEADAASSICLYNLACFNALLGHQDEAQSWLEKAVQGGFYAPQQMARDADLKSLRGSPRFQATLARAGELAKLAAAERADDKLINSSRSGEAYRLTMEARRLLEEQNYAEGLKIAEQALTLAPKDPGVLYALACSHALLEHPDKALTFLEQAVSAGYYCPQHIVKDEDLKSLRGQERFEAAVVRARTLAGEHSETELAGWLTLTRAVVARLRDAFSILDYSATIETTDGFSTRTDTVSVLASDAKDRPIYPFFGKRPPPARFDRYLPKETLSFSVSGGVDFAELYRFAEDTVRQSGPPGEEFLAHWAELQQQIGLDIHKDLLDWIGGEFVEVSLENGSSVWLIQVRDEKLAHQRVTAGIEYLTKNLAKAAQDNPPLAALMMMVPRTSPVQHAELPEFQNLHFAMSPNPVVWGVADGQLIFGTSAEAVVLCLDTARGEHPSIRENPRAMSEMILPDGPFVMVTLTDQRQLGNEIAGVIGLFSMLSSMAGAAIPEPSVRQVLSKVSSILGKLVPVAQRVDFFKSTATCTTFDGRMGRMRTVTHYASPQERSAAQKP
jgi:tetratricopeptide (TPR) repeat protein